MYFAYKLNKQGDLIQSWRTPFQILRQSIVTVYWVGPRLGAKMGTSGRAHADWYSLGPPLPVFLPPQWATYNLYSPSRSPSALVRSTLILMEVLLCAVSQFLWVLMCILQERRISFSKPCGAPALRCHWPSKPNVLPVRTLDSRPSYCLAGLLFFLMWQCHCADCVGLIFFGAKAVFNMYICLLFPLCMKAIILLKRSVPEVVVTWACTGY